MRPGGFRTREAGSGAEALDLIGRGVSAVVLDVHLPDIDGFEVCRMIRARPATARCRWCTCRRNTSATRTASPA